MAGTIKDVKYSPIEGKTELKYSSPFGPRKLKINGKIYDKYHNGIDITTLGNIVAFEDGIVTAVRNTIKGYDEKNGSGNYVTISHGNGNYTTYCHMDYGSVCVNKGDRVVKGQKLGTDIKKTTGFSTGLHLHFGLKVNNQFVDPIPYLTGEKTLEEKTVLEYKTGIYQTMANMRIRKGPGTNYPMVKRKECTDAMKSALTSKAQTADAIVEKGRKITALEIIKNGSQVWMKNYSGYICIKGSKEYCKFVK